VQGQTEIIAVRVRDESAVRAAIIANAIAKSFIAQLPTLVNRVENVSVIDRAVPAAEQISPRPILNMVVALVAALMLGVLLAFLADYFDDVVKTPDDVKKVFGLRVLAVVPDIGSEEEWLQGFTQPAERGVSSPARQSAVCCRRQGAEGHPRDQHYPQ
jgi:capsular polysaccharide biosynthesis protein